MKMLMLAPSFPLPARRGDQVVTMARIKEFHRLGVQIHLVCLNPVPAQQNDLLAISEFCSEVKVFVLPKWVAIVYAFIAALSVILPLQVGYYFSLRTWIYVRKKLKEEKFDAIHVVLLRMAHYVGPHSAKSVLELVDSMALNARVRSQIEVGWRRLVWKEESRRLRSYESQCVSRYPECTVVSKRDRLEFPVHLRSKIAVLPNGCQRETTSETSFLRIEGQAPFIAFFGNLNYRFNVEGIIRFSAEVWPILRLRYPNLVLKIVGAKPTASVCRLVELDGVQLLADVPAIQPEITGAICSVVPLSVASGMQNKIIESMAAGIPVIASEAALDGLPKELNAHVLAAHSIDQWNHQIAMLLESPKFRNQLATNGAAAVRDYCSWEKSAYWLVNRHRALGA